MSILVAHLSIVVYTHAVRCIYMLRGMSGCVGHDLASIVDHLSAFVGHKLMQQDGDCGANAPSFKGGRIFARLLFFFFNTTVSSCETHIH